MIGPNLWADSSGVHVPANSLGSDVLSTLALRWLLQEWEDVKRLVGWHVQR